MAYNFHHAGDPEKLERKCKSYLNCKKFELPAFIRGQSLEGFTPRNLDHGMNQLRDRVAKAIKEKDYERFPDLPLKAGSVLSDPESGDDCFHYDHLNDRIQREEGVSLYDALEIPAVNQHHETFYGVVIFADWGRKEFVPYMREKTYDMIVSALQAYKR